MSTSTPGRILVVNPNNIGDVVLSTSLLRAIRTLFPRALVGYLAKRRCLGVLEGRGLADETYAYDFAYTNHAWQGRDGLAAALVHPLREKTFDLVVSTWSDLRANIPVKLLCGLRTPMVGLVDASAGGGLLHPLKRGTFLLNTAVEFRESCMHAVDRLWLLARRLQDEYALHGGTPLPPTPYVPYLPRDELSAERVASSQAAKILAGRRYAVVHPGSNVPGRHLPVRIVTAVADWLVRRGMVVCFTGTGADGEVLDEMLRLCTAAHGDGVVDCRERFTVGELVEFIRGSSFFVGNDTGPLHAACAVGVPVVGVYSCRYKYNVWRPYRPLNGTAEGVYNEEGPADSPPDLHSTRELLDGLDPRKVVECCELVHERVTTPSRIRMARSRQPEGRSASAEGEDSTDDQITALKNRNNDT